MIEDSTPAGDELRRAYRRLARESLPQWGIGHRVEPRLVNLSENAMFEVGYQGRRCFLRVHRAGYHDLLAIRSELAWSAALRRDLALPTPVHVRTSSGADVASVVDELGRPRHAALFEALPGVEPAPDDLDRHLPLLGATAARMHEHAQSWRRPTGFTRFRWDSDAILGPHARWGRWQDGHGADASVRAVLGPAAARVAQRIEAFGYGRDRFGLVHADMRLANLLVDGDDVAVLDFDDSGFCWYLFDFAATVSFHESDPRVPQWCERWMSGYESVRPLLPQERSMLATFVLLRRLMLVAWLGSRDYTELADELGARYTLEACDLAEHYLSGTGWAARMPA